MGKAQKRTFLAVGVSVLVFLPCAVTFCSWTTWKTYQCVLKLTQNKSTPKRKVSKSNSDGNSRYLPWISLMCVLTFTLSLGVCWITLFIWLVIISNTNADEVESTPDDSVMLLMLYSPAIIGTVSFDCLITVLFMRLRLTFLHTQFRLTQMQIRFGQASIALLITLQLSVTALTLIRNLRVLTFVIFALSVAYVSFGLWCIYGFTSKTLAIAKSVQSDVHFNQLVDPAVRMTIVTTLPALTSFMVTGMYGVIGALDSPQWTFYTLFIPILDICFNNFCVLTTFKLAQDYYDYVFGSLHGWVIGQLKSNIPEFVPQSSSPPPIAQ